MLSSEKYTKLRYQLMPDHLLGEILSKRWIDNAIPFAVLLMVIAVFGASLPGFFSAYAIGDYSRQFAELGLIVLAMAIVLMSGGIDLSVGSIFALANLCALYCVHLLKLDPILALGVTSLAGALCGAFNGVLIGFLKMRAFLTTLVHDRSL